MNIETASKTYTLTLTDYEMDGLKSVLTSYLDGLKPDDYVGSDPEEPARSLVGAINHAMGRMNLPPSMRNLRWSEARRQAQWNEATGIPF